MNKIDALVVSENRSLSGRLRQSALENLAGASVTVLSSYPNAAELTSLVQGRRPNLVFVDIGQMEQAIELRNAVLQALPYTNPIAVGQDCTPEQIQNAMEQGFSEFLAAPFHSSCLRHTANRVTA
jgi:DNA-binding NtrC family response regulator